MKGFQSSKYPFVMYADRARKHLHGSSLTGKLNSKKFMGVCRRKKVPAKKDPNRQKKELKRVDPNGFH